MRACVCVCVCVCEREMVPNLIPAEPLTVTFVQEELRPFRTTLCFWFFK